LFHEVECKNTKRLNNTYIALRLQKIDSLQSNNIADYPSYNSQQ